jgi:DGQHR domain-containing protein
MVQTKQGNGALSVPVIVLSEKPAVYMTALPGPWLLSHSTPSWRIDDPQKGFQRIVKAERAREIARTVLETRRPFPNAIMLATDAPSFKSRDGEIELPGTSKFLVVDGQHRLWAQKFSKVSGVYPCVIHMDRSEKEMAELFLEINDNQRRVPSSLRWDLVRLVRKDDQATILTVDIVFELATRRESPFERVGIDLTGEKSSVTIKQGSLAPEIKTLVARQLKKNRAEAELEDLVDLLIRFFVAIRSLDPDGWGDPKSTFFKARVLRALLRVLSDMLMRSKSVEDLTTEGIRARLERIDRATLSEEEVRRAQGSAGVRDLYVQMRDQVFGDVR